MPSLLILLTVMEVQRINAGHKDDVTFPSEDDRRPLLESGKEKIFLKAELFEKKGGKAVKWSKLLK